jgi:valyl-tRNA synthetase
MEFVGEILQLPSVQTPFGVVFLGAEESDILEERAKIEQEIEKISALIELNEAKLTKKGFLERAPAHVVAGAQSMLAKNIAKREELQQILSAL